MLYLTPHTVTGWVVTVIINIVAYAFFKVSVAPGAGCNKHIKKWNILDWLSLLILVVTGVRVLIFLHDNIGLVALAMVWYAKLLSGGGGYSSQW